MMLPLAAAGASFGLTVEDEAATGRLAIDMAHGLEPGDLLTLSGDLGAGKTAFTRALIRYAAANPNLAVPSPSFTLMQSYQLPRFPLVHADLYRLASAAELSELGFDDLPEETVIILEWPDRAAGLLPPDRFDLAFTVDPKLGLNARHVRLTGYGRCAARAERILALRKFLARHDLANAERKRIQGDASTRSYERLRLPDRRMILMNAPRRPDGPPVRNGKPYSAVAHLAEDVRPFVAMANGLRGYQLSAPEIYAADLEQGFVILEDLGEDLVVGGEPAKPIGERYGSGVDLLATLHRQDVPTTLPLPDEGSYRLPDYDFPALLIEAELLLDWYIPRQRDVLSDEARLAFRQLWQAALDPILQGPKTWVLRDYHSPNLLWLAARNDIARVGLLDFQDTVVGHPAYDLASLLQDARVSVDEDLELSLFGRYVHHRRDYDQDFDVAAFGSAYSTLAAQRASKILGIFVRLERRDGKPQYLRHIPRVWGYLQRSLAHPALQPLAAWYSEHVPEFPKAAIWSK